jgi:hypothetical protein
MAAASMLGKPMAIWKRRGRGGQRGGVGEGQRSVMIYIE